MRMFLVFYGVPTLTLILGAVAIGVGRLRKEDALQNLGLWLIGIAIVSEIAASCAFGFWSVWH